MGFGDLFKATQNKTLQNRIAELESLLTPEMRNLLTIQEKIAAAQKELNHITKECEKSISATQKRTGDMIAAANKQVAVAYKDLEKLEQKIKESRAELVETEETVLMQSFGLYTPKFAFANSTGYKEALADVRAQQKEMIKQGTAVSGTTTWSVNGSASQGKKMVRDTQKLLLRAFNCECDDIVDHVKFNNIEASEKRIHTASTTISKLGTIMSIAISPAYVNLKIKELFLAYEFQVKKQEEKDRLKQLRAEERERAKLEKEIEEARKKIDKEQSHYTNALLKLNQQLASADVGDQEALLKKKAEIENHLSELNKSLEQIDYRAANQKAGYVYIISNIGAFGEGVYKIGMTRRLEPMDRIDELGDASVPFDFDVHALIFSEDAPALEAALHRAFESRKLNMVNTRREFFRVSLEEIKSVVMKNFDKTVEFIDTPAAVQFRESELILKAAKN